MSGESPATFPGTCSACLCLLAWPESRLDPRGVAQWGLGRSWEEARVGHGGVNGTHGHGRALASAGILFPGRASP